MNEPNDRLVHAAPHSEDADIESSLRPRSLDEFVGQDELPMPFGSLFSDEPLRLDA